MKNEKKEIGLILSYYKIMCEQNLEELKVENKTFSLKIKRKSKKIPPTPLQPTTIPPQNPIKYKTITSPLTGTFYRTPSPTSPPFVKENDVIEVGTTLCIIEAMKVMNEIKSNIKGKVVKILVENGSPVKQGQELFWIE